jgi:hypothetical protein
VECQVIGRMGEYLRITPESFSDYLYMYSKTDIVQQRMYLGLKGKWEWNQFKFLSKNKPVKIDEFMYIRWNGIFTRNTWMSIIEYRFK